MPPKTEDGGVSFAPRQPKPSKPLLHGKVSQFYSSCRNGIRATLRENTLIPSFRDTSFPYSEKLFFRNCSLPAGVIHDGCLAESV